MASNTCRGLFTAALTALALPAFADIRLDGGEFRANSRVDFRQLAPAVAFAPGGGSLVVWENDQKGIRGQLYGAHGGANGAELTLVASDSPASLPFSGTVVNRRQPAIASFANGRFLLAWTEERSFLTASPFIEDREVQDQDIFVQRFSANGSAQGARVRVNTTLAGFQRNPVLVARGNGFLVVWEDSTTGGIVGRAIDGGGQPIGAEIKISEAAGQRPAAATNAQGKVLVVWDGADGGNLAVFARLLDTAASPAGAAFRVNAAASTRQARPSVAAGGNGSFLVAWQGEHPEIWSGFFYLYGRAVSSGGALVGAQARLYVGSLGDGSPQISPALVSAPDGHFLLTWLTWRKTNDFTAAGVELDDDAFAIDDGLWLTPAKVQRTFRDLAAAGDGEGGFLVSWEAVPTSASSASSPRSRPGIAGRRLASH